MLYILAQNLVRVARIFFIHSRIAPDCKRSKNPVGVREIEKSFSTHYLVHGSKSLDPNFPI